MGGAKEKHPKLFLDNGERGRVKLENMWINSDQETSYDDTACRIWFSNSVVKISEVSNHSQIVERQPGIDSLGANSFSFCTWDGSRVSLEFSALFLAWLARL